MAERIRRAIGIGVPVAMLVVFIGASGGNPFVALLWILLAGPFLIYYLGIRTPALTILVSAFLVGLSIWAIRLVFTDTNSTAALNALWIPYVGYPVSAVSVGVDYGVRKLREGRSSAARQRT